MALTLEAERAEFERTPIPPTEAEWLEARRPWWGASIVACLFGEHEHITLGDACTEKIAGRGEATQDEQRLFDRGHRWEPYLRDQIRDDTGLKLVDPTMLVRRGPIMATPDADVLDREDVCVELKTAREFLGPVVKRQWWWQAQALNWCLDTERCLVAALDSSLEVVYFEVERDDDAIQMAVNKAQSVLDVISWGEMPSWVDLSADNVKRLHPRDSGESVELPPEIAKIVVEYEEARKNEKAWEQVKLGLRDRVVQLIGADALATVGGEQVASYRTAKDRTKIDFKQLALDHPDWVEPYTTTVPGTRTFRPSVKGALRALEGMSDDDEF